MSDTSDTSQPTTRSTLTTRLTHLSAAAMPDFASPSHPVWRTSTVLFPNMAACREAGNRVARGERGASTYGTSATPTTQALCDAIAAMEGDGPDSHRCALMPSGLAAITVALLATLKAGDHMLMADSVYGPARMLALKQLAALGIETSFFDPCASAEQIRALWRPNTKVLYIESPGSYTFEIQDIPALSAVAHELGGKVVLDNTWASPLLLRPFELGVDLSVIALTKYWGGHADVLMGAVVCRADDWLSVWQAERAWGICVGGDDAALVLRGMRTLAVRVAQHEATALTLAKWLQDQPMVKRVLHPALPDDPHHALFKRDFLGSNGLFGFEFQPCSTQAVDRFVDALKVFRIGYSWGGFESLVMPASLDGLRLTTPWTGGPLIRLHAGLEPAHVLQQDLEQALRVL